MFEVSGFDEECYSSFRVSLRGVCTCNVYMYQQVDLGARILGLWPMGSWRLVCQWKCMLLVVHINDENNGLRLLLDSRICVHYRISTIAITTLAFSVS